MTPQIIFKADGVRTGYGEAEVLRGASMPLGKREIVGLMPIGAGTLLVFGRDFAGRSTLDLQLLGLGDVAQEHNVVPNLSVLENLERAFRVAGGKAAGIDFCERLTFVEFPFSRLAERRAQYAGLMSAGEQRMGALGMGLILKPQALLLDEPTTGLAPVVVQELMKTIRRLREKDGISVLIVEQNITSLAQGGRPSLSHAGRHVACNSTATRTIGRQNIWEYS